MTAPDSVMGALWCLAHGEAFALWDDGRMSVEFPGAGVAVGVSAADLDELTRRGWAAVEDGAGGEAAEVRLTESGRYHLAKWARKTRVAVRPVRGATT